MLTNGQTVQNRKKKAGVTYLKFTMNFQTDLCASRIVDCFGTNALSGFSHNTWQDY